MELLPSIEKRVAFGFRPSWYACRKPRVAAI